MYTIICDECCDDVLTDKKLTQPRWVPENVESKGSQCGIVLEKYGTSTRYGSRCEHGQLLHQCHFLSELKTVIQNTQGTPVERITNHLIGLVHDCCSI